MATNSVITKVTGTDTSSNRIASTFYGTCSTGASTAAKAVTLSDSCVFNDSCLVTGATIHVKFTNSNTNATPTLKVGTATAKQIMAYGTTKAGTTSYTSWYAGAVISFTYDGTYWQMNDYVEGVDISTKMDKVNPTGTGSLSLNRKAKTAIGTNSVAEGSNATASGYNSHAEGNGTTASGNNSHSEGSSTVASGDNSHAEGFGTQATANYSHAEGGGSQAKEQGAHAEGAGTQANGAFSHSEGGGSQANGAYSHAEGNSTAGGDYSHGEGIGTIAASDYQHAGGKYNISDEDDVYAEIIGNGTSANARSNARTLDWSGNEVLSGTIDATGFGTTLGKEVNRSGVTLTQAQYDALVQAGTVDADTTYFITDAQAGVPYASGIPMSPSDNTNVAAAISASTPKVAVLTSSMNCSYADSSTIGYRSTSSDIVNLAALPGYPSGKTILGFAVDYAYVGSVGEYYHIAQLNIVETNVYCNAKISGLVRFRIRVSYV